MKNKKLKTTQVGQGSSKKYVLLIALISIIVVIYLNSFNNSFVWDDKHLIENNQVIKSWNNFFYIFGTDFWTLTYTPNSGYYRPIITFSYMIDYTLWRLKPFGYHLTNTLFHTLNAILIFFIVLLIFKKQTLAFFGAMIFAAHPILTEAVTWIAGRTCIFVTFFYLFAFMLFLKNNLNKKKIGYKLGSCIFFAVALFSKETAITLPLILILSDYFFISKTDKNKFTSNFISRHSIFLIISGVYLLLRFITLGQVGTSQDFYADNLFLNFIMAFKIYASYLKLLLFPIYLNAEFNIGVAQSILESSLIISIIIILFLIVCAVKLANKSKEISFGIYWIFITLLPVSNIIPLGELVAERFLYLPSIGFCLILAKIISMIPHLRTKLLRPQQLKFISTLFFVVVIAGYSLRIIVRNKDWKDEITLFKKTIESSPNSARAHFNLGNAYYSKGLYKLAESELKQAVEIDYNYTLAHNNLGVLYGKKGFYEKATIEFEKAISSDPNFWEAYANLGGTYLKLEQKEKAISMFEKALKINPNNKIVEQILAKLKGH